MKSEFAKHFVLADLLMDLEMALREGHVWDMQEPSPEDLLSVEPFCIDTMHFAQWLRFVMIERFKVLIEQGGALPTRCHISPMAEEAFQNQTQESVQRIVKVLDKIDAHLSQDV